MSNTLPTLPAWLVRLADWAAESFLGKWLEWFFSEIGFKMPHEYRGLIILFLVSQIVFYACYFGALAALWLVRGWRNKAPEATGRWATIKEIKKSFSILPPFAYFMKFRASLLVLSGAAFYFIVTHDVTMNFIYLACAGAVIGGFTYVNTDYISYRRKTMPYPLGMYKSLRPCLVGGIRKSLFLGQIKDQRQEHVLIIGPTGSGKTTAYFIPPLLEDAGGNCSAIVIEAKNSGDDKEDMLKMLGPTWHAHGKKVLTFDPWSDVKEGEERKTLHFNPLLNLKPDIEDGDTRESIDEIVDAIYRTSAEMTGSPSADGAYHEANEKALVRGLIYIALHKPANQRNIIAIRHIVGQDVETVVGYINSAAGPTNPKLTDYIKRELMWFTSPDNMRLDTKANTLRGIANKLDIFTHPKVKACTIDNTLVLDMVFKEPCLFIIKSPMNVIGANVLASVITRLLMLKSQKKLKYGAGKDFKVWFYLDELPTLCLPELSKFVATARSAGVGVVAAVQDKADLTSSIMVKRGTNSIESLLTNLKNKIILPGCGPDMAEYFSKAWGVASSEQTTMTRGVWDILDFRYMKTTKTHRLISSDDIYKMDRNRAIIDCAYSRPFMVTMEKWFESRHYRKLISTHENIKDYCYMPDKKKEDYLQYQPPDLSNRKLIHERNNVPLSEVFDQGDTSFRINEEDTNRQTMANIGRNSTPEPQAAYFATVESPQEHHGHHGHGGEDEIDI